MISLNKIFISGRLTQDPEIREVGQNKTKLAKFGIAFNRKFGTVRGQKKESLFVDIQVWDKQAEFIQRYMHKGDTCVVEGELVMEQWRSKMGEFKSRLAIKAERVDKVFVRSKEEEDEENGGEHPQVSEDDTPPVQHGHRYSKEDATDPGKPASAESGNESTDDPLYDVAPF